jgi:hypothetical protein
MALIAFHLHQLAVGHLDHNAGLKPHDAALAAGDPSKRSAGT